MSMHARQMRLLLASASPRRKELLASLGLPFEVKAPDVDESIRKGELPRAYVERVAAEKAAAVAAKDPTALVLAADTSVVVDGEVLGKPRNSSDARAMLRRLSGRSHQVLSAVALDGLFRGSALVETTVEFRALTEEEIAWYVSTGEPMDKAGAYAVQGKGGALVRHLHGSASNVVGLPLAETIELLRRAGVRWPP